jgi:hypothetical protein
VVGGFHAGGHQLAPVKLQGAYHVGMAPGNAEDRLLGLEAAGDCGEDHQQARAAEIGKRLGVSHGDIFVQVFTIGRLCAFRVGYS